MNNSTRETQKFAFIKYRYCKPHVAPVDPAVKGVVKEERVAFLDTHRTFINPVLYHILYGDLPEGSVEIYCCGAHRKIALGRINPKGDVTPSHACTRSKFLCRLLAFEGDHIHFVTKDLVVGWVQVFNRPGLVLGNRLRLQPLDHLVIPAIGDSIHSSSFISGLLR